MFPNGEPATRLRGTAKVDPYSGEPTGVDWSSPDALELVGGFSPGTSAEPLQTARNAVSSQPEFFTDYGADVLAGDRLVVRGRTYDVDGDPSDWRSPFSAWRAGMVIALKRTEG